MTSLLDYFFNNNFSYIYFPLNGAPITIFFTGIALNLKIINSKFYNCYALDN